MGSDREVRPAGSVSWSAAWEVSPLSVATVLALKFMLHIIRTK